MGLAESIQADLVAAMKAGDDTKKTALRAVLTEIKTAQTAGGADTDITDEKVMSIIASEVKKRSEAAEIYEGAGETARYQVEVDERDVLQAYLPEPLSQSELDELVGQVITEGGYSEKKDMGTVIKEVIARSAGRSDGRAVSAAVGKALSQ